MTDEFDTPEPQVKRDGYGRYRLPHPITGKEQPWTRVTTLAKTLTDEYGLNLWKERMAVKGISLRPDLLSLVASLDVKADSKRLNKIVEQAKETAGASASANLGTAIHSFTESVDNGGTLADVPEAHRADVKAYADALEVAGITIPAGMTERITCVPEFGVAGTLDRIYQLGDGRLILGDVKTGRDLSYNWVEICTQLAMYQMGVSLAGVFDLRSGTWSGPVRGVDNRFGIVAHIPVGSSGCTLYEVDLEAGRRFAELAVSVRAARKERNLAVPFDPTPARNWEAEFAMVVTRESALALYREAKGSKDVGPQRLLQLVELGRTALTDRT